ncbi:alanine/ornithine racemase family PLP-dependent enzyme [Pedobacter sp. SD-b]|uniref:Alanine/ornithine racemase family PLP-dependent enzyme n=1 Tax=Pedobacter segetis TaxID=2793069 RepID=A0ABS1BIQ8_9SPHI|nr:alanine/ornithine racemase family PLP-dependent enzyme [Pedobacter segetis]MBK0382774.1 alanine/ornithine racemase family PLP-dependent enzyme [Pedobacter segetis]
MAYLKLYKEKLAHNYSMLEKWFTDNDVEWGVVSKLLCGNQLYLQELVKLGVTEFHDTRISNLKMIKKVAPKAQTVYIKPPAKRTIPSIIKYADVSFNTDYTTIKMLSAEAVKQNKTHKIIIMIEMGDLREGVVGENLLDFYDQVIHSPNINIVGLGTNLNCLNGILPSQDKLIQLSLYKQLIEAKFNIKIPWISGGTSVTVPLLIKEQLPKQINHFRVGEVLFFGLDLFTNQTIVGMNNDVFRLYTEIIELYEKPKVPSGDQGFNVAGETPNYPKEDYGKHSYRAILDIGLLDCNPQYLIPDDENITIIEASSDMLVLDVHQNDAGYKVGDTISFKLKYMGVLGIMNSDYVDKVLE